MVIIALASDEQLMEHLVLKGGNAIQLLRAQQNKLSRVSNDFDFSMEDSFDDELDAIKSRIQRTISDTFSSNELVVFDYQFSSQPRTVSDDVRIEIEISKFEYVAGKQTLTIDDHTIYIYSVEMIVFEKLRAICQQNLAYAKIIPGFHARPIYAKRVPLSFIEEINKYLEIHRGDWKNLLDTLPTHEKEAAKDFDYYAAYVTALFHGLTFP
ncbi:MAG TPA: nucleotidyl transferase AbiEii/AbiGii toxin family protein [Puia sp.]|nr:nucleotidyl transferase AbiEii/AbiGii toxin family protein [Puia sp.]